MHVGLIFRISNSVICGSFNDAVGGSHYMASDDGMINE